MDNNKSEDKYHHMRQPSDRLDLVLRVRELEDFKFYSWHRRKLFTVLWFSECLLLSFLIMSFDEDQDMLEYVLMSLLGFFGVMVGRALILGVVTTIYGSIVSKIEERKGMKGRLLGDEKLSDELNLFV